jgi:hypothetical protein
VDGRFIKDKRYIHSKFSERKHSDRQKKRMSTKEKLNRPTLMKTNKPTTAYILQKTVSKTTAADWLNLVFFSSMTPFSHSVVFNKAGSAGHKAQNTRSTRSGTWYSVRGPVELRPKLSKFSDSLNQQRARSSCSKILSWFN